MEVIAVMFPSVEGDVSTVSAEFEDEFAACEKSSLFSPVLYNEHDYVYDGADLVVSRPAPVKSRCCILRGRLIGRQSLKDLPHALKRFGYHLAFCHSTVYEDCADTPYHNPRLDYLYPNREQPYHRHESSWTENGYSWWPDLWVLEAMLPAVAKNNAHVLKDDNGKPVLIETLNWGKVDSIATRFSNSPLTCSWKHAPMWIEEHVKIAQVENTPVEWRLFFYEERLVYLCPKSHVQFVPQFPEPPQDVIDSLRGSASGFYSFDLALDISGKWKVLKERDGQFARVPKGGSPQHFYNHLEMEILRGPYIPEWSWCLVGDIVESHLLGKEKREVYGTRHFAPKTKVYVVNAFWGLGAERCTALGVPRYTDHLVGVNMATNLIENFRCEKVYDKDVLKAMWTNRLAEDFERDRATSLWARRWANDEESGSKIERIAEMLNRPDAFE